MPESAASKSFADFYNPELSLIRVPFDGPGYHSKVPAGTVVHDIRSSFAYALDLVCSGTPDAGPRAAAILGRLLPLQDANPVSPTYGLWSWLYEEPLSQMDPPDWNWADFCGFRLAQILYRSEGRLPAGLVTACRSALFHAAGSIYRRNMGPHYTNISIMGGLVTAMAGELLDEARLREYGEARLRQAVDHHRQQGGFNEYNSPTYTWVVLKDCEQALGCLRDPAARALASSLHRSAWEVLARHFHPATGQWAGPHSRAYSAFLQPEIAEGLEARTGAPVRRYPGIARKEFSFQSNLGGPGCPPDLSARFRTLPEPDYCFEETFIKGAKHSTTGTTWMHEEACLGSVNQDHFWDQRRAVLGYWNDSAGTPVALRLRFLKDGKEFCSAFVHNRQSGPFVLSAVHLLLGRGDWHPVWGGSESDTFSASDWRLRYELRGNAVEAQTLNDGTFELSAGDWTAILSPAAGTFHGTPFPWIISRGEGWVSLDAVLYTGPAREFPFRNLGPLVLAAGVRLRRKTDAQPAPGLMETERAGRQIQFRFGALSVTIPDHAVPLPEAD